MSKEISSEGRDKAAEDKVLPCPFCGNQPEWVNLAHPSGIPALQCSECQFKMQQDRRDKTIFYWNRRTPPSQVWKQGRDKVAQKYSKLNYAMAPAQTQEDAKYAQGVSYWSFIAGAEWQKGQEGKAEQLSQDAGQKDKLKELWAFKDLEPYLQVRDDLTDEEFKEFEILRERYLSFPPPSQSANKNDKQ